MQASFPGKSFKLIGLKAIIYGFKKILVCFFQHCTEMKQFGIRNDNKKHSCIHGNYKEEYSTREMTTKRGRDRETGRKNGRERQRE